MSKRRKFIIATIVLTLGIVAIRYPFLLWRYRVALYALMAGVLSFWSLLDPDLKGIKRLTITSQPVFFAISAAMVFPLLPPLFENFLIWPISYDTGLIMAFGLRLLYLGIFAVGYYASLLCGNIFNVASIRTIQLLRAAHSVGFILTLSSALLLYLIIASFHLSSFFNIFLIFAITFPLVLSNLWAVNLTETIGKRHIILSLFIALAISQVAWAISFWPLTVTVFALFLTAVFYVLVGLTQYYLSEKLFAGIVREFIIVSIIIFLLVIINASWTG